MLKGIFEKSTCKSYFRKRVYVMNFEKLINEHKDRLTSGDLEILSYFIENKDILQSKSINEISLLVHASQSSIVRLTQKLGFSGFSEFRYYLKSNKEPKNYSEETNIKILEKDIENTLKMVSQIDLDRICKCINQANRVFIYGTDWGEKKAASDFIRNFMSCGVFLINIPSITEFRWVMDYINSNDLIIIISFSGENASLESNITQLKIKKIPICSVTTLRQNYLSSEADYQLYYQFTPMTIKNSNELNEYNLFITLNIVMDSVFRAYLDFLNKTNK